VELDLLARQWRAQTDVDDGPYDVVPLMVCPSVCCVKHLDVIDL
jgi:hypothetical protein